MKRSAVNRKDTKRTRDAKQGPRPRRRSRIVLTPHGRRIVSLAHTFRVSYKAWHRLKPNDRAVVSFLSGLFIGRLKP